MDEIIKYSVTQSNKLIEKRGNLTLEEQRVIMLLISLVQPEDEEFKAYELKVSEFARLIGVKEDNKYKSIKESVVNLFKQPIIIRDGNKETIVNWLSSCTYIRNEGKIILKFSEELRPYLLQLKEHFTTYKLQYGIKLNSKYGIRVYEICKMNQYKKRFTITLDELRYMLKCENYERWVHLKQKVIEPSLKEINLKTDLFVDYKMIKESRRVIALEFTVKNSSSIEEDLYTNNPYDGIDVMKDLALTNTIK